MLKQHDHISLSTIVFLERYFSLYAVVIDTIE